MDLTQIENKISSLRQEVDTLFEQQLSDPSKKKEYERKSAELKELVDSTMKVLRSDLANK